MDLSATAISYNEVESYCRLTGVTFSKWEIDAIMRMNAIRQGV